MDETSRDAAEANEMSTQVPAQADDDSTDGATASSAESLADSKVSQMDEEKASPAADQAAEQDDVLVSQLREKLEGAKARPHEYVKLLVQLAEAVVDVDEKVAFYREAANLYADKGNKAEAARINESIIEVDPADADARGYLRATYETQRKFDKLIDLMKLEAELLDDGPEKTEAYRQIAQLATERIKKPEVCIELWDVLLDQDPDDVEALQALAQLYERARDYEKLVDVLERVVPVTYDEAQKIEYLTKLGQIAGDRLKDDERAVEAYRQLLVLSPDDRRAQDQLKKRYVALGRWDDLELFYEESGNWDEFIRLLESNESKAPTDEARVSMLSKAAELWTQQKGKPDRAARALEKILTIDSTNLDAAEQLIPIYEQGNNAKGLANAIEVKLAHLESGEERLALLLQSADLYESRLRDKKAALARLLEAVALDPERLETQDRAEDVARSAKAFEEVVEAYRGVLPSIEGSEAEIRLRLRLGRILSDELSNTDEALAEYRTVYDDYPDNQAALEALEALYQKTEGWTELLEVYQTKLELSLPEDERKATQFGIAQVQRLRLDDAPAAIVTYETVLDEDAGDETALKALDELYAETEAWERQAGIVGQRIALAQGDDELVNLKFRLGDVLAKKLGDLPQALMNYREVLQLDISHAGARHALEGLLEDEESQAEAARILETVFEALEDWAPLAQVLEVRAEAAESAGEKVDLLRKLAQVSSEHLGAKQGALDAQARALRADPRNEEARLELLELAESAQALDTLGATYKLIAEAATEEELALSYWMRLAELEERQNDVEAAAKAYGKALAIDAGYLDALVALDALYRSHERWEELAGVYRRRIDLAEDEAASEELYGQLAEVLEVQLAKPDEAIAAYQEVLSLLPQSTLALQALDRLFTKLGRFEELASNLEAQLVLAESEAESIALTLRLAGLRESQMGEVEAAVDGYREVLERDPRQPEALAALERLLGERDYELVVAEILEPLYRQVGAFEKLTRVYEIQVRRADEPGRQVELLTAIAELQEDAAGDAGAAFDTMARALSCEPANESTLETLMRLAMATDRFSGLASVIAKQAAEVDEPELQSSLYMSAARILEENVGDAAQAVEHYKRVLDVDPMNVSAAVALQRLYQATGQFDEMSLILQKKATIVDDVEEQKASLYEAARIEEEILGKPEGAVQVFQKVLEIDEEDLQSIEALIGLYLGLSKWQELLRVYARKADLVFDVDEKKQVLYEVGAVYERELSDVESAIDTYQRVLELDPDDLIALGRLDVLYQRAENWQELLGVLTRETELTADPEESVGFQYRVARLYESRLGDVERAVELYRELLGLSPDHDATLSALEELQHGKAAPLLASAVLEQVYESSGDAGKLVQTLEVQVTNTEDAYATVDLLQRIAQLQEERLGSAEAAFSTYARAVALDSQSESVLENFERLATMTDAWQTLAKVYDAQLEALSDRPEQLADLGLRVAQVYEVQLDDVDQAIQRYEQVSLAEPHNIPALSALDRLYAQTEQWAELASVLARESEYGETPDEILEFKYRLGQVHQLRLGQVAPAIDAYREVLAAAPEHEEAVAALENLFEDGVEQLKIGEVLEPLYQANADWEKLLMIREGQLESLRDVDARIRQLQRMAEEAEEKLMDVDQAFSLLLRALSEQPSNERTIDELERLASTVEDGWGRLTSGEDKVMRTERLAPATVAVVGQRLGRAYEEELYDVDRAIATYRFVLTAVPQAIVALENLDRIFSEQERYHELAQVLALRAEAASESFEKVELYLRLGHTHEEKLAPLGALGVMPAAPLADDTELDSLAPPPPSSVPTGEALDTAAALSDPAELLESEEGSLDSWLAGDADDDQEDLPVADADGDADLGAELDAEEHLAGSVEEDPLADASAIVDEPGESLNLDRLRDAIAAYRVVFDELQPDNEDAIESLERCYSQTGEWEKLDVVYARELEHASGDADEAEVRAKRARIASRHLGQDEVAVEGWKRVLDLRGEDPEALRELAFLYEKQSKWSELTDVLERHFDIADSDEDRVHVLVMRARLFDEQLNRDDEALETYQRVVDIDYANATALRAIANIWRRRRDDEELVSALHQLVDAAASQLPEEELVSAFREMAKLHQDSLDQVYEATEAWRHLLEVGPGDFEALDRLEAIYRGDEQWTDVIDVKMQRADALAEPAEKISELLEVTELWRSVVREYDRSIEAYNRILLVEPLHEQAFSELVRLHTAQERWEPLIELYLNRLEHEEEVAKRSDLLRRIARVFDEQLDDQNQAFDALVSAFADDFFDDATSDYLARISQATGRWGELLTTANAWLKEEEDRRRKIQLSLTLGKWYGEDLGRPTDAMAYYGLVLEVDPNNTRVMRQMASIERLAGNYQKAGQMLNKALEVAVANEDRKAILGDLGDILFRTMNQPEQAIAYYRRALEVDSAYLPALTSLEKIYEERGQVQDLVDILRKKSKAVENPADALREKLRLGDLLEAKVGDVPGATKAYREALEISPNSLPALRGLERTLSAQDQWPELVEALERQLDVVDTERDRVAVLMKLADVQENQFLKADVAAQRLEQALDIDHTQEAAYVALARCYRRLKQYNDLVDTYRRHLEESLDRNTKIELYANIGSVVRDELGDLDQAIDAFQAVVDADETNVAALDALSKLYEKQDDSARAIEMMTRVAELTVDGAQQVDMYFRIGRAMEEKLGDRFGAREKFEMALDLEPRHLPSLAALRTIAVDEADWEAACRYLDLEQQTTELPRQRARLLVELGKIRDEMLSEHAAAISAYEQAIELDADCEEAALPLVHEYGDQSRWADAAPLAEMLARKSRNRDKDEQKMLHKLLGQVMSELGDHEKALKAYQAAHQLDLTDQETIRGVADAAYAMKDWPSALTNYQKVLTSLAEEDVEERTDVYWRLGMIKKAQNQDRQAINNFEKALALDGEHRPSLEVLIEIYANSGENRLVAEYKRQILDSVFDGDERFDMLMEIGDLWSTKENDPLKALEAYEEARDLKPQDHVLLHKMVQNYQRAEEWQKMVDVLDAIMEIEERPSFRAKLLNTQAQIYRDMLEDKSKAVELFNEALDLDPTFLEAFERIDKILTKERNWKQLERSYRKMLHRVAGKGNSELEHNLWHQLGIIYRDRTGQTQEAIEAFRMSSTLVKEAPLQRQILAELYESTEQWDDAIKEQRIRLRAEPLNPEPYQALYRLYLHKQAYDESWALAAALSFMGQADADQERFYQDCRPEGMLQVSGRLADQHWDKALVHPHENRHISEIFKFIVRPALKAKLAQMKKQGTLPKLDERFRQDPDTSTVTFARTFGWASQVLGVQPPALYVRNDVQAYIGAVAAEPPACVAGQLVLSGFQPQELTFISGKHLTLYRPEHYLKALFPTQAELTIMLFAAIVLAAPQQPVPPDLESHVRGTAQELAKHAQPVELEGLRQAVKAFLADGAKANIKRWNHAVEHTACRAGLILCCDLNVAKKIIASEQQQPGELSPQEKLTELLVFATSVEYSALRKAMGVAVRA